MRLKKKNGSLTTFREPTQDRNILNTKSVKYDGSTEAVARRCSVRKGLIRNFAKFTEKHLRQGLFCNKVAENIFFPEHLRATASDLSFY